MPTYLGRRNPVLNMKNLELIKKPFRTLKRYPSLFLQAIKYWIPANYKSEKYWKDRLSKYGLELQGAGDIRLSHKENEQIYLKAKEVFLSLCRQEEVDFRKVRMLDIGCGTGFYAGVFLENGGKDYLGIDITDALFNKLRNIFPDSTFSKLDICTQELNDYFDLIIMIDVTQHIINSNKFSFAMQNVRSHLNENGIFIVTSWLNSEARYGLCELSRTMKAYKREFPNHVFSEPMPFRDKFIFSIKKSK